MMRHPAWEFLRLFAMWALVGAFGSLALHLVVHAAVA
jgi:hypothetical protein